MNNGLDYELNPFTTAALAAWRDGNDPSRGEDYLAKLTDTWVEKIAELDDYTKGIVIIDLLTLCDSLCQVISVMKVNQIEKGMEE